MEDVLPIFENKPNSRPKSSILPPSKLREFLNEQVRLQLLANATSNPNELQSAASAVYELFPYDQDTHMEDATDDTSLQLLSVGNLSVLGDKQEFPKTPLATLHIKTYQENRTRLKHLLSKPLIAQQSQSPNETPATDEPMDDVPTPLQTGSPVRVAPPRTQVPTETSPVQRTSPSQPLAPPSVSMDSMHLPLQADVNSREVSTAPSSPITECASENALYDPQQLDTTLSSLGKPVYAYPLHVVPIFATPAQIQAADTLARSSNARSPLHFSINKNKVLETLNFLDSNASLQHEWNQSGKTMFLKLLFDDLKDEDKVLTIVTPNLDTESVLHSWIKDDLQLKCVRLTEVIEGDWMGEYGVSVKTLRTATNDFKKGADVVMFLDIRAETHTSVSKKIKAIRKPEHSPPAVYLIPVGSVEWRWFQYLKTRNLEYSEQAITDDFKALFFKDNKWPANVDAMQMNQMVASHFSTWLHKLYDTIQNEDYQYRDTVELPQTYHFANLKTITAVDETETIQATASVHDSESMDISDEEDDDHEPVTINAVPKTLSPSLTKYIEEVMFPSCEFTRQGRTSLPEAFRGGNNTTTVSNLVKNYNKEVQVLMNTFEKSVKALQEKYRKEAKETFLK